MMRTCPSRKSLTSPWAGLWGALLYGLKQVVEFRYRVDNEFAHQFID